MSEEPKKIKFKNSIQQVKLKGTKGYRPKLIQSTEEFELQQQQSQEPVEKISIGQIKSDKIVLQSSENKIMSISNNETKITISQGQDGQSLNSNKVSQILQNEEDKQNNQKDINIPIVKQKKVQEKVDDPVEENYIRRNLKNETFTSNISSETPDEEITKVSFAEQYKKQTNSKSTWGQSSFGSKKPTKTKKSSKPADILADEELGIFRTSTSKKPKYKPKDTVDDDGFIRSSQQKKQPRFSKGKKEIVYDEKQLYNYGLNRLAEQDYARHELLKKMKNLQSDEDMINRVLDLLVAKKFLNDDNRVRSFLRMYSSSESVTKTKQRLLQKGFNKKEVERIIEEMNEDSLGSFYEEKESDEDKAFKILRSRYRIYEDEKKEKMNRFLISRGFSYDVVSSALKKFSNGEYDSYDPYS